MNPVLIITLLAGLGMPGFAGLPGEDPAALTPDEPEPPASADIDTDELPVANGTGLVDARATARADGLGVHVDVDHLETFIRSRLPGPGFSRPLGTGDPAGGDLPIGAEQASEDHAEAVPVQMPSPEEVAIPAGLAVLGAVAVAAARWRYVGPWLLAPLYSRIKKDDLLENEVRAALVEEIEAEPGLSLQELSERAGSGWGNTVYHLQRLEQAGFVRSEKQGHHRRFYKVGEVDDEAIEALGMLRNETPSKIARYVVDQPGCKQKDVCEALGISASLAHKYLKRMEEQELVTAKREWRSKHYTPDARLAEFVEQIA